MSIASCIRKHASALRAAGIDPATLGTPQAVQEALGSANELLADVSKEIESKLPQETMLQEDDKKGPRAAFTPAKFGSPATITLTDNMSLASLTHELAHYFFQTYISFAPNSPTIAKEVQKIFKFLEFEGTVEDWNALDVEQKRPYDEKLARHFEAYAFEGKAPSFGLQSVFNQMRSFMLQVYTDLKGLITAGKIDLKLNDEIRGVFDRMIASDEAIKERMAADGYQGLFEDQEDAGATDLQWENMQDVNEERVGEAFNKLSVRSVKNMRWLKGQTGRATREEVKRIKGLRDKMEAEVEKEVSQEPVYRIIDSLKQPDNKLSRQEFQENVKTGSLPRGLTSPDGVSADVIIAMTNTQNDFKDALDMMSQIAVAQPKADRITEVTNLRMLQTYGDLNSPAAFNTAVAEAVYNKAHTRFLHTELSFMTEANVGKGNVLHRAAKAFADSKIMRTPFGKIIPSAHLKAEKRAQRNATTAHKKGDRDAAIKHMRVQIKEDHLFRAATAGKKNGEIAIRAINKFKKKALRKTLTQEANEEIDAIFKDMKEYKAMTLEELQGTRAELDRIRHVGQKKKIIKVGTGEQELDVAMDRETPIALKNNPQRNDPKKQTPKRFKWVQDVYSGFLAGLVKVEGLAEEFDGNKENGFWWNALVRPLQDAGNAENIRLETAERPLLRLVKSGLYKNAKTRVMIGNVEFTRDQLVALAQNWGTEYAREAWVEGMRAQGINLTQEDVIAAFDEHLSQQDWADIVYAAKYLATYWQEISDHEYKLTGVRPEQAEVSSFETKWGTIEGYYHPLVYDSEKSWKAFTRSSQQDIESVLAAPYINPMTKHGYVNARVGSAGQAIRLDTAVYFQHISNVIHDLSYREAIMSVDKVILDPRFRDMVWKIAGLEVYKTLRPWLANVASGDRQIMDPLEKIAKGLRRNATIVNMGYKFSTAVVQFVGYSQTYEYLGAKYSTIGLKEFYKNPKQSWDWVMEHSPFMRERMSGGFDRDVGDAFSRVKAEVGMTKAMQQYAFKHIGFMDMLVSMPSYLGAYRKAVDAGMGDVDAHAQAEKAVRMSQSSGSAVDLPGIAHGNEYKRLVTMFFTYFSSYYNLMRRRAKINRRDKISAGMVAQNAMSLIYLTAFPAILSELIVGRGPEDDEEWERWASEQLLSYPLMSIPLLRDGVSAGVFGFGYTPTPAAALGENLVKVLRDLPGLFEGEEVPVTNLAMASGYLLGLPLAQLRIIAENSSELLEGTDMTVAEMALIRKYYDR